MSRSQSPEFSQSPMDRDSSPPYGPSHMDRNSSPPYGYSPVHGKFKPGDRLGNVQRHQETHHVETIPSASELLLQEWWLSCLHTLKPTSRTSRLRRHSLGYWSQEDNPGYTDFQLPSNQFITLEITISSKLAWITLGFCLLFALMVSVAVTALHPTATSLGSSRLDLPNANNVRTECPYGFSAMRGRKDEI
ncbi:hypothetical protein SISSUDRAFT_1066252 [Sistotremastrum suecicum HHB10207 ss-3]|uniref:Uncharacterized protein n=1 Tax=Sistotremastrum suecicum HHB10207 ss-3 TaxID=1314776 RepID=A0A165YIT0_9AGAM|nr:hypothetical protein SISSUDRAFT_1066252 [Sistotremastrum suecicum HHB10207 ss-3]